MKRTFRIRRGNNFILGFTAQRPAYIVIGGRVLEIDGWPDLKHEHILSVSRFPSIETRIGNFRLLLYTRGEVKKLIWENKTFQIKS